MQYTYPNNNNKYRIELGGQYRIHIASEAVNLGLQVKKGQNSQQDD